MQQIKKTFTVPNGCVSFLSGRGLGMKKQLDALKCRDAPPPLAPRRQSLQNIFYNEGMAQCPSQQPANPTGHHTGWPLPHSVNPLLRLRHPDGIEYHRKQEQQDSWPRAEHTHINTNAQHNIPVKALLGSMSIQGHRGQHLIDGSVPNHSRLVRSRAAILVPH